MRFPNSVDPRGLAVAAVFLGYPYLVYRGMDSGLVFIAPLGVSLLYFNRALESRNLSARRANLLIGLGLVFGVVFLKSQSAKFLPVLVQLMLMWFFGRTLVQGPALIERLVRLDYPVFPPGIAEYCRRLTWIWTLFFGFNAAVLTILAIWASDGWWAFYAGVMILVLTGLLLIAEYWYRGHLFPDLEIPDPGSSFRSILANSRKIWSDVHAR